ncbi:ArsR/SmtB family transcription factor [Streptomyces sp. NPDC001663]|uniref:ArsR/SmtB family transcription factor n=1 Tax=Streptomyces sp. NPDC001663 TaxID=3364597 RepID=UPI00367A6D12
MLGHVAEGGRTTTEPARSTGMTPATAGHHATVLRDAGLLSTHRLGGVGRRPDVTAWRLPARRPRRRAPAGRCSAR